MAIIDTDRVDVAESTAPIPSANRARPVKGSIRVFHLVDTLNVGGTENQLVQMALRMRQIGHRITVGCLRAEGPLLQVLQRAGIPVA